MVSHHPFNTSPPTSAMGLPLIETLTCVAGLFVSVILLRKVKRSGASSKLPFPPGPPRLPILGNTLNIPAKAELPWKEYAALAQAHGEIVFNDVLLCVE